MMRCTLKDNKEDWDLELQQLASAIRSTENRHTGFTNFLMLGRETIKPIDIIAGTASRSPNFENYSTYVKTLVHRMESVHETVRHNLIESQVIQKRNYDIKLKQHKYEPGDVVHKLNLA